MFVSFFIELTSSFDRFVKENLSQAIDLFRLKGLDRAGLVVVEEKFTNQLMGNGSSLAKCNSDLLGRPNASFELLQKGCRIMVGSDAALYFT